MFRNPAPAAAVEPAPVVEAISADALIPVSHLALDLPEPAGGWVAYLKGRGIEVVEDGIGGSSNFRGVVPFMLLISAVG